MKFAKPWYRKSRRAWFVTLNGKQIKLGVTKQEALNAYHKLMADPPRAEEPREAPKEYVVGIIQRFMRHVRAELAEDTIEWYRYRLQRFVDHLASQNLDGLTVAELRPHHVREWVNSCGKLSPGSKRNLIRAVQRCFNWAAEDRLIPFSPIAAMKQPKAGKRETVVIGRRWRRSGRCWTPRRRSC